MDGLRTAFEAKIGPWSSSWLISIDPDERDHSEKQFSESRSVSTKRADVARDPYERGGLGSHSMTRFSRGSWEGVPLGLLGWQGRKSRQREQFGQSPVRVWW